ncbi:hypothetical protein FRC02_011985 [Tulasnella sp. 418]|nr:hypothetical protein FRC02_011985 [Tulasnella sp. 418]
MSFNTTWGSSTRQDHQTFMNSSQPQKSRDTQKPRSVTSATPLSYGIGASASPPRLSSKPPSRGNLDFSSESAAEHHSRLKQRNESVFERDPEPSVIPYQDTSVNVANAIHRAVIQPLSQPSAMNGQSNKTRVRRQPSAEPRLGAPPAPGSRRGRNAMDHLDEGDRSEGDGGSRRFERAKSPIEQFVDVASKVARAVSPGIQAVASGAVKQVGSVFLQPPSKSFQSFAVPRSPSRSGSPTKNNSIDNAAESYNYSAEEHLANNLPSGLKPSSSLNGRKSKRRLDHDQKAYKPSEESEDEDDDVTDGGTRRKKKGVIVKGLTNLPVVGPEKKRRSLGRKDRGSGGSTLIEDREGSVASHTSQGSFRNKPPSTSSVHAMERNGRNQTPLATRPPFEEHPSEVFVEDQINVDEGPTRGDIRLEESSDLEELNPPFVDDGQDSPDLSPDDSGESLQGHGPLQIGATLGRIVNVVGGTVMKILLLIFTVIWQALTSSWDLLVTRPVGWAFGIAKQFPFIFNLKTASAILLLGAVWYGLMAGGPSQKSAPAPVSGGRSGGWSNWIPTWRQPPTYTPPEMPAGSIDELVQRLSSLESAFAQLSEEHRIVSQERDRIALQVETTDRDRAVVKSKLDALEAKLDSETLRAIKAEESYRASSKHGIDTAVDLVGNLREEVKSLSGSISTATSRPVGVDRKTEERIGYIEAQLKDVTEKALKTVVKDKKDKVKLVSSDGKDISNLVATLIAKDAVGMPDFALYYAGGAVAPWMTSQTLKLQSSWLGKDITGRPPVTALVPDISIGNCWSFGGSRGQIGIRLSRVIELTHVSVDHPTRELLIDETTAPRQFNVWIAVEGEENVQKADAYRNEVEARRVTAAAKGLEVKAAPPQPFGRWNLLHVGSFEYDMKEGKPNVQTFELDKEVKSLGINTGAIVVDFTSNWGNSEHTCVYRVRAHGKQVSS